MAASNIVDRLFKTYESVLTGLEWMDEETKIIAKKKLANINKIVGFIYLI